MPRTRFLLLASLVLTAAMARAQTPTHQPIPTLWIIGDSTAHIDPPANAAPPEPRVGRGTPIANFFDPAKIRVVNAAKAGRSSRTYFTEHRWDQVLQQLQPGDDVLINFGHNDPGEIGTGKDRGSLPGTGDETQTVTHADGTTETVRTYGWYLRRYIADTRSKSATPILLSVTPRNIWTDGKVQPGLGHFREWTADVARATNTDYIDLSSIVVRQYQKLGAEKVAAFFPLDHTHTNLDGATLNARSVVAGLKALPDSPLSP